MIKQLYILFYLCLTCTSNKIEFDQINSKCTISNGKCTIIYDETLDDFCRNQYRTDNNVLYNFISSIFTLIIIYTIVSNLITHNIYHDDDCYGDYPYHRGQRYYRTRLNT